MTNTRFYFLFLINLVRCIPHILVYLLNNNRSVICADVKRGLQELGKERYLKGQIRGFVYLMAFKRPFRNIFYYRIKHSFFLNILCPGISTLEIASKDIGEGLYIQSGIASLIGAESIGKRCTIYQQVTIGWDNGYPIILDNVTIYPGAVIFGKITIGNNVTVGANATVYKNIPDNSIVIPGSSLVINGLKIKMREKS